MFKVLKEKYTSVYCGDKKEDSVLNQHKVYSLVKKFLNDSIGYDEYKILANCSDADLHLKNGLHTLRKIVNHHNNVKTKIERAMDFIDKNYEFTSAYIWGDMLGNILNWWIRENNHGKIQEIGYYSQLAKSLARLGRDNVELQNDSVRPVPVAVSQLLNNLYLLVGIIKETNKYIDANYYEGTFQTYIRSCLYSILNGVNKAIVTGEYTLKNSTNENFDYVSLWLFYMDIQKEISPYMNLLLTDRFKDGLDIKVVS
jgi:hypothetical protein